MEIFKNLKEAEEYCDKYSGEYDISCGCGCDDFATVEENFFIIDNKVFNEITQNNNGDINTWTEQVGEIKQ